MLAPTQPCRRTRRAPCHPARPRPPPRAGPLAKRQPPGTSPPRWCLTTDACCSSRCCGPLPSPATRQVGRRAVWHSLVPARRDAPSARACCPCCASWRAAPEPSQRCTQPQQSPPSRAERAVAAGTTHRADERDSAELYACLKAIFQRRWVLPALAARALPSRAPSRRPTRPMQRRAPAPRKRRRRRPAAPPLQQGVWRRSICAGGLGGGRPDSSRPAGIPYTGPGRPAAGGCCACVAAPRRPSGGASMRVRDLGPRPAPHPRCASLAPFPLCCRPSWTAWLQGSSHRWMPWRLCPTQSWRSASTRVRVLRALPPRRVVVRCTLAGAPACAPPPPFQRMTPSVPSRPGMQADWSACGAAARCAASSPSSAASST